MLILPVDWRDEQALRRLFTWQTRVGLAPRFGTLPIGYYQQDQAEAYDSLKDTAERFTRRIGWEALGHHVRVRYDREGYIYMRPTARGRYGWTAVARVHHGRLYDHYYGRDYGRERV